MRVARVKREPHASANADATDKKTKSSPPYQEGEACASRDGVVLSSKDYPVATAPGSDKRRIG